MKNKFIIIASILLVIISLFPVFAQENIYSNLGERITSGADYNTALGFPSQSVITSQDGIITTSARQTPRFQGYIIQFKEESVLKKKTELEGDIIKSKERSEQYKEEAEQINTQGINIIKAPIKFVKELRADKFERITEKKKEEIINKLKEHKDKVLEEHRKALEDIKSKVSSITGNAVSDLENKKITEYTDTFNGVFLNVSLSEAEKIKKSDYVKEVYPNYEVNITLMDSVPQINADNVWQLNEDGNNCTQTGKECLTGKNITIAIIDTGVDYTHPDLGGCFGAGCKVVDGYDFVNEDNDPMDDHGHGTHCAATAAGNGVLKGVAPDAEIYAYKVLSSGGGGYFDDIIAAIERAVDPNNDSDFSDHVDVISMSLGGSGNPDDALSQAVDIAVESGIVAVIAAGNSGPGEETIGSPGTARKAITVGAVDKNDTIAFFSSRGPVIWEDSDGNEKVIIKPDVVAPGVNICAAQASNKPWTDSQCLDDKHVAISGTSMATPHVAGAVALIKQAHPDWSPEEIKMALRSTAVDVNVSALAQLEQIIHLNPQHNFTPEEKKELLYFLSRYSIKQFIQGYGRIDVLEAVNIKDKPLTVKLETNGLLKGTAGIIGTITGNILNYSLEYGKGLNPPSWTSFITGNNSVINGTFGTLDTVLLDDGKYTLRIIAKDNNGNKYEDRTIIKIHNDPNFEIIGDMVSASPYWGPLMAGDINDDNKKEIIAVERIPSGMEGKPKIWAWNSKGNIVNGWPIEIDYWYAFFAGKLVLSGPALADIDNDGINEVLLVGGSIVYAWNGDGSNVQGFPYDIESSGNDNYNIRFPHFSVGDVDDDNKSEILFVGSLPSEYINGTKVHHTGELYVIENTGITKKEFPKNLNVLQNSGPAIADINNDGINEIVVASMACNSEGTHCGYSVGYVINVLDKNGSSLPGWPFIIRISENSSLLTLLINPPVVGDLDNDGELEIIITLARMGRIDPKGTLEVFYTNGTKKSETILSNLKSSGGIPSLSDLNNDSILEIITEDGKNVFIIDEKGEIISKKRFDSTNSYSIIGDVDGDNNKEILIWNRDELYILDNNLNLKDTKTTDSFSNIESIILTDLENNGKLDIVGASTDGKVFVWRDIADYNPETFDWPMFQHDPQHTGCYGCEKISAKNCFEIYTSFGGEFGEYCNSVCGNDTLVGCPQGGANFHIAMCQRNVSSGTCSFNKTSVCENGNWINCSQGCEDGACVTNVNVTNVTNCTDTDRGMDYYERGKGIGLYSTNKQKGIIFGENLNKYSIRYDSELNYTIYYDHCFDSKTSKQLNEAFCINGVLSAYGYQCPNGCEDGACIKIPQNQTNATCTDTDNGINLYQKGKVCSAKGCSEDYCQDDNYLFEYDCGLDNGIVNSTHSGPGGHQYFCPNGCKDGACIEESFNVTCTDSDGGLNYYIKGKTTLSNGFTRIDECVDSIDLREYICGNISKGIDSFRYNCPNGCKDGSCVRLEKNCTLSHSFEGFCSSSYCTNRGYVYTGCGRSWVKTGWFGQGHYTSVTHCNEVVSSKSCSKDNTQLCLDGSLTYCPNGCENGACIKSGMSGSVIKENKIIEWLKNLFG